MSSVKGSLVGCSVLRHHLCPEGLSLGISLHVPKSHTNQSGCRGAPCCVLCSCPWGKSAKRSVAPSSTSSLGFLMGGHELPFPELPKAAGKSSAKAERLWLEFQCTAPPGCSTKHPERFQWVLFCLIKNTNQACMYYLIYINIYSIYKTNASGQRLSLWHKL